MARKKEQHDRTRGRGSGRRRSRPKRGVANAMLPTWRPRNPECGRSGCSLPIRGAQACGRCPISSKGACLRLRVHPRVGGGAASDTPFSLTRRGATPRGRGSRPCLLGTERGLGCIPTSARPQAGAMTGFVVTSEVIAAGRTMSRAPSARSTGIHGSLNREKG